MSLLHRMAITSGSPPILYQSAEFRANGQMVGSTGSLTLIYPTYEANDILFLAITTSNASIPAQGQTNLTNNGWARVANSNTKLSGSATTEVILDIWWQRASTAAQTAVSVGDAGDHTYTVVSAFKGANVTGNPWDTGTAAGINVSYGTASAQTTSGNVTTSTANCLIVSVLATPRDIAGAFANASPLVLVDGSGGDTGLTELCDYQTSLGGGSGIAMFSHRKPSAGATANVRANTTTAQTSIWWCGALKANIV